MEKLGLKVKYPRAFRVTTQADLTANFAPNLLDRNFNPEQANQAWCGDISYVKTNSGFLYLATVIDLYSRRGSGWSPSLRSGRLFQAIRTYRLNSLRSKEKRPGPVKSSVMYGTR